MINQSIGLTDALWTVKAGGYEAKILPEIGGNLISLKKGDAELLHQYDTLESIAQKPTWYGLPVLFPPNRIEDGVFTFEGRRYEFPRNEVTRNNSLHGFLQDRPWKLAVVKDSDGESQVCLTFEAREGSDFYPYYPHVFTAQILYTLNHDGLTQEFKLRNDGTGKMPFGLGWHSAFRAALDTTIQVSVDSRVVMSERMLPTGDVLALSEEEEKMRTEGLSPFYADLDGHFTSKPLEGNFHGAVITTPSLGIKTWYEVDSAYKHWMIWNCEREGSFICIEPQNWRVNAPNLPISEEESGMASLLPGENFVAIAKIWAECL